MEQDDKIISALVILRPSSGRSAISKEIRSDNVAEYSASEKNIKAARDFFEKAGFKSGSYLGTGFAITAPINLFEEVFKIKGLYQKNNVTRKRLPVSGLAVKELIEEIVFDNKPDFGPENFY